MTPRQFHALRPGDRVHWSGRSPEGGTVARNERTLIVRFDSGVIVECSHALAHLFHLSPSTVDQVCR